MKFQPQSISETETVYTVDGTVTEHDIFEMATAIARKALSSGEEIQYPRQAAAYIKQLMQRYEAEVFSVLLLDTRHRVIAYEELFHGTVDGASVYPREVVKCALRHNASSVWFAHNHPSGNPEPSMADINITHRLRDALSLVDIRVIDHIVIGIDECASLAERGVL